jgi:hypothetical protein
MWVTHDPSADARRPVSRYAAPVLTDPRPACALLVRVAAVAVASVLLGVLAHGSMAGVLPRPGSLFVIVVLVLMLVGGLLAAGQGAGRWARRHGWSVPFEDAAGVLALVVGQALVHWLVLPVGVPGVGSSTVIPAGHVHAGALPAEAVMSHPAAATGPGMLVVHAVGAAMVAVALRWVEAAILGLVAVLRLVQAPMAACLGALRARSQVSPAVPMGQPRRWVCVWWGADLRPRLRVTLLPLERRGPPAAGWIRTAVPI